MNRTLSFVLLSLVAGFSVPIKGEVQSVTNFPVTSGIIDWTTGSGGDGHTGWSWSERRSNMIAQAYAAAVNTQTNGIAADVYVRLRDNNPSWWDAWFMHAQQRFNVDLRAYTASNGYQRAEVRWGMKYSRTIQWQELGDLSYGQEWHEPSVSLTLGIQQTSAPICVQADFGPPRPDQLDTTYGGYHCYTPQVYLYRQAAATSTNGVNPGAPESVEGDPVNTISGGMLLDETDVAIPTPGMPLEFRRHYRSGWDVEGALGPRWRHNYDWRLWTTNTVFSGATNLWLVLQTGEDVHWKALSVSNGGHEIPQGLRWDYIQNTNGTYDVVLPGASVYAFGQNGLLTAIRDGFSNTVALSYSNTPTAALVIRAVHSTGAALDFTYTGNKLTGIATPSTNLNVSFAYDADGNLTNVARVAGTQLYATTYAYAPPSHVLTQRLDAAGTPRRWEYADGKCTNSFVGTNRWYETAFDYGSNSIPRTTVRHARDATNVAYDYEYDPLYRKILAIYGPNPSNTPQWVGTRYTRDDWGNATGEERADWSPAVTSWTQRAMAYDSGNRLTNWAYGYQATPTNSWSFSWNTNWSLLASLTDPEGHKAEWDYTNGAVSVERLYPVTNQPVETRYAYTSNGLVAAVTNANGHWTAFQYDLYGYPTTVVSQAGLTNWMTWDALGHLKEIRLPSAAYDTNEPPNMVPRVIAFDPDELGRVRSVTYPDNSQETFAFDGIGNVTNHVDTAGRTTRYVWLPTRKLASASRFLTAGGSNQEAAIQFAYDQQFNALNIKDELGRAVESYQLDLQDRPTTVTNVESQQMTIVWGLGDKVQSLTRFDSTTAGFAYGVGGQVSQAVYGSLTNTFTYYRNGLPTTAANTLGTVSNAYDGANRLISSQSSGAVPQPQTAAYSYYPAGNVSNVVTIAGTNTYAYDAGERLSTLTAAWPGLPAGTFQYTYNDLNGAVASVVYPNGLTCSFGYDSLDRLTGLTWTDASNNVLRSRAYGYGAAGMITNAVYESGERVAFTYDSLDRLTGEKHVDASGQAISQETYGFDLAGNRTNKTVMDTAGSPLITVNYSLPTGNRLGSWSVAETNLAGQVDVAGVSSEAIGTNDRFGWLYVSNAATSVRPLVSGINFCVYDFTVGLGTQKIVAAIRDAAGNMGYATNTIVLSVVTNGAYQYSAAGCVTNIQYKGQDYQQSFGLTWDSQYRLTAVSTNGGVVERYGYDALGRRAFTWDAANGTNWHVYDGVQVVADLNATGALVRAYTWGPGIDNLLAMTVYGTTTNTYYALRDHLGSILALTDTNAAIVESYRYDAWGRTTVFDASGNTLATSAVGNRYCWQGREYSWKTGLYYFRARYHDPVTGRWLSPDPIGITGGLNMFVFAGNNPVNFRDPFGLCEKKGFWRAVWGGTKWMGKKLWNFPNTAVGTAYGLAGFAVGLLPFVPNESISFGHNAIQFENNPLSPFGGLTLGNAISYPPGAGPDFEMPEGTLGEHEEQHTYQGELLGLLYLPAYLVGGAGAAVQLQNPVGPRNFMESGPYSTPPRPW